MHFLRQPNLIESLHSIGSSMQGHRPFNIVVLLHPAMLACMCMSSCYMHVHEVTGARVQHVTQDSAGDN